MPRNTSAKVHRLRSDGRHHGPNHSEQIDASELLSRLSRIEAQLQQLQRLMAIQVSKPRGRVSEALNGTGPSMLAMLEPLSPRERQVMLLFAQQQTDKQIARTLDTKLQTVRNQMASIAKRLGATSRQHLLIMVLEARFADGGCG